jgi:heterotetrameric sarcosine oxidase gamma subunit
MPEPVTSLVAQSGLPAGGRVFADALKLSVMPTRAVLRLQLGARSQKSAGTLRIAERPLPLTVNRWNGEDPVIARISPDSWLLVSAWHEAGELLPAVRTGCGRRSCAVTDLSDSLVTIAVEGALAPSLLARGCGIDVSAETFGNDACTRTRLAGLAVVLRRVATDRFECLVDRPSAQWLYEWMEDVASGLVGP